MTLYSTLIRRSPLRPVSAKRAALEADRAACRKAVRERAHGQCEAGALVQTLVALRCSGPLDIHEVKTRARGGSITDPANCILVCRQHHDWIGEHPQSALELGLLRNSWED